MRPCQCRRVVLIGIRRPGWAGWAAWLLVLTAFTASLKAETPVLITNLAQLSQAMEHQQELVADAQLRATVFACDTNTGATVLQDGSRAELLELDGLNVDLQPGDQIELAGPHFYFAPIQAGIYVSSAPLINNDGVHVSKAMSNVVNLAAGHHPVRVDWFNQLQFGELALWCVPSGVGDTNQPENTVKTNLLHAVSAECYEGYWLRLPNFQLLPQVKSGSVTNFDTAFRTRDEMVGLRLAGYVDIPETGPYAFHLRSDDGSRLWIGDAGVPVRKTGNGAPPSAPRIELGQAMPGAGGHQLATVEGRVRFASHSGKGMHLELYSDQGSVNVEIADSGALEPGALMDGVVSVSGVTGNVLSMNQKNILGTISAASSNQMIIIEAPPDAQAPQAVIRTVAQIHSLASNEVSRGLPVEIRGVVTTVGPGMNNWIVIQDETRGTFVGINSALDRKPKVGELWKITGRTKTGGFAPEITAETAEYLGPGRLPEPAYPTWSQLASGSMDVQWVELRGLVTGVSSDGISLLLPEGRETIKLPQWGESELKTVDQALVRIRGTLFADWDNRTHEARVGKVTMNDADISVEEPAPKDPFDAPIKTPRGLFRFDAKATPLQRVKVLGQVTYVDSRRLIIQGDSGLEVYPGGPVDLRAGDLVEAVGYPALYDTGPQLRGALVRKTGAAPLPEAPLLPDSSIPPGKFALNRIRIEGSLAGVRAEGDALVMQIQAHTGVMVASIANGGPLESLRLGSELVLTGVYVSSTRTDSSPAGSHYLELLVNDPADVLVISAPSWWTLQRLLTALGVLITVLVLASVWIAILRHQVSQRTLRLQREIREREQAERRQAVESERARIARDLHDELGSGLTEMSLLASAGLGDKQNVDQSGERLDKIAERARSLVSGLDVIVWAIDPGRNSLQEFADYIEVYAEELLSESNIQCRFKIPVQCRPAMLAGATRHSLLLAVKEALANIIRHAWATEVELQIRQPDDGLEIIITDNGHGFDPGSAQTGDGLRNLHQRLKALHGSCEIDPTPGKGTSVKLTVPLDQGAFSANGASI